ncbi:MAG: beta-ketoacyl-ACP synthase III [Candidatus Diapherotrites archaeon]
MKSAGIAATGIYVPEKVVTNKDIEKLMDTSDEWIWEHIGIRERRFARPDQPTSDLAIRAGELALKNAGIGADELDMIFVATCSPDMFSPSTACIVQDKIGAGNAGAVDVNNACTGFVYGLEIASKFIADSSSKNVLLIGAEKLSVALSVKDRSTYVFFADGAGAAVLKEAEKGTGVIGSYLRADGSGAMYLGIPAGGTAMPSTHETLDSGMHTVKMNGGKIWGFAVKAFPDAVRKALERTGYSVEDVDMIIPHQANYNIIVEGMKKLGLPMEKTHTNMDKYGNTVSASIPIALHEAAELGKIKKGDLVVLAGFGGGLSWGANVIRWGCK